MAHKRRPRHRRVPQDERPPMRLTDRDVDIMRAVNDPRALLTEHIRDLLGIGKSQCYDRLEKLFQHGYLKRQFLSTTGGGPASARILHILDVRGAEVLIARCDYEWSDIR